jgi:hypothetical protein
VGECPEARSADHGGLACRETINRRATVVDVNDTMSPTDPANRSGSSPIWFLAGAVLMGFALCCSQVTMVTRPGRANPYTELLTTALLAMAAADFCFGVVLVRGPVYWRVAAAVASLPSVFVIGDFLSRA